MRYFGSSLLIHLLLLLWLFTGEPKPVQPLQKNPLAPQQILELTLVDEKQSKVNKKDKKRNRQLAKKKKRRTSPHISLQDLKPKLLQIQSLAQSSYQFNHGQSDLKVPDNSSAPWGEGGHEFNRLQDYIQHEKVVLSVSHILKYPHPLAHRKIGGVVNARLVIDENGNCHWPNSTINGNNIYLRFYILTVLKQFCSGPFWHGVKKRKSSNLDFSFYFNTYSKDKVEPRILGNVILMELPGYQDRGNWKLGPLQGHYAFPNFIFLNPTWIVEQWNSLMNDEDPLSQFQ